MHFAILSVTFPPDLISGSLQVEDLCLAFKKLGHNVTVFVPDSQISSRIQYDRHFGIDVLRIKTGKVRDCSNLRRLLNEALMPFDMWRIYSRSNFFRLDFDGVITYSPSIFFTPLSNKLKKSSNCSSYLILRDIFPQWAHDLGLLKKGFVFNILERVALAQYRNANVIGVQSASNVACLPNLSKNANAAEVEVLHNWLAYRPSPERPLLNLSKTALAGKKIFVYAGNIGIAQGAYSLMGLLKNFKDRVDIGFLFIGRGTEFRKFDKEVSKNRIPNVLFHPEVPSETLSYIYRQCVAGIVILDQRHTTHNIPGKFVSYMTHGLPVLAFVNPGNDILSIVKEFKVGQATSDYTIESLIQTTERLLLDLEQNRVDENCTALAAQYFSPDIAVKQIASRLKLKNKLSRKQC